MQLTIIEGVWGAGKSTLLNTLCRRHRGRAIHEPRHLPILHPETDIVARTRWYVEAHATNLNIAVSAAISGQTVFVERCGISSLAFWSTYGSGTDLKEWKNSVFQTFESARQCLRHPVRILHIAECRIPQTIRHMLGNRYLIGYADATKVTTYALSLRILLAEMESAGLVRLTSIDRNGRRSSVLDT